MGVIEADFDAQNEGVALTTRTLGEGWATCHDVFRRGRQYSAAQRHAFNFRRSARAASHACNRALRRCEDRVSDICRSAMMVEIDRLTGSAMKQELPEGGTPSRNSWARSGRTSAGAGRG